MHTILSCKNIDVDTLVINKAVKKEDGFYIGISCSNKKLLVAQSHNLTIKSFANEEFVLTTASSDIEDFLSDLDALIIRSLKQYIKDLRVKHTLNNKFSYKSSLVSSDGQLIVKMSDKTVLSINKNTTTVGDLTKNYPTLMDMTANILVQPYITICGSVIKSELALCAIDIKEEEWKPVVFDGYCFLDSDQEDNQIKNYNESDSDGDNYSENENNSERETSTERS